MRLTFLGTGGVWAAPVHGCTCAACVAARRDPSRARGPASALLEVAGLRLLIDAGHADLTTRFPPGTLDGVLLTHFHADHVLGLMLMRWSVAPPLPVWCPQDPKGFDDLRKHPGRLRFQTCSAGAPFSIGPITVTPVALIHSRPTLGWVIDHAGQRLAWLCDTRGLPDQTYAILAAQRPGFVALDCAYPNGTTGARNHNDLDEASALLARIAPQDSRLLHLNHELDAALMECPTHFPVAWDGEQVVMAPCSENDRINST